MSFENMSEAGLQMQIVAILNSYARPDIEWHHVPNGEQRDKRTAARLKKMGVKPGVADLMFLIGGKSIALELKTAKGRQSPVQREFQDRFERAGGTYFIAHGFDEAIFILKSLRVIHPAVNISVNPSADDVGVRAGERQVERRSPASSSMGAM